MIKSKVRWIIGCATMAVVIIALLLSIEIASRDFFCDNCHINAKVTATWKNSPHAKTNCVACHAPAGYLSKTYFVATHGTGNLFKTLFGDPKIKKESGRPSNSKCLECHTGIKNVVTTMGIKIPHKNHAERKGSTCSGCHFDVAHASSGVPVRPPMITCLKCHNGDKASRDCDICHTATASASAAGAPGYLCAECHIKGGQLDELSPPLPPAAESGG